MPKNIVPILWSVLYPYHRLDPDDRSAFSKRILIENIKRLRAIAVFGGFINLIIMGTVFAYSGPPSLLQPDMVIRGLWTLLCIVYIVLVGKPQKMEDVHRKHYLIFTGMAALSLLFSSLLSTYIFQVHGYSLVHVVNLLLTGSFIFLSVAELIIILSPSCFYLAYVILSASRQHF